MGCLRLLFRDETEHRRQLSNKSGSQRGRFQSVLKFLEGKQLQGFPFMFTCLNVDPRVDEE